MFKDPASEKILSELRELKRDVAEIQGERDAVREDLKLSRNVIKLREELETLKIEKARKEEDHAREKREVEHMVGLERKRSETEREMVKRETTVQVREENLNADKERFETQMKFTTERFGQEIGYLKEIMVDILKRLPTVNASITERVGAAALANGHAEEDD